MSKIKSKVEIEIDCFTDIDGIKLCGGECSYYKDMMCILPKDGIANAIELDYTAIKIFRADKCLKQFKGE